MTPTCPVTPTCSGPSRFRWPTIWRPTPGPSPGTLIDIVDGLNRRTDVSPLGAGALAGSSLPLDPAATAEPISGSSRVFENSLDITSEPRLRGRGILFALAMLGDQPQPDRRRARAVVVLRVRVSSPWTTGSPPGQLDDAPEEEPGHRRADQRQVRPPRSVNLTGRCWSPSRAYPWLTTETSRRTRRRCSIRRRSAVQLALVALGGMIETRQRVQRPNDGRRG